MSNTLFPLPPAETPRDDAVVLSLPRVERPNRAQLELRSVDLDGLLPPDHRARIVWEFVEGLDLSPLYAGIRAVEGAAGRPAIDPAILTALWLYATLEGVGSARALDRLCEQHDAYRWIAGGVSVNYHTLADFRVAHADGGFAGHDAITELAARGCTVYAPVPQPKDLARDPHQPREADSAAVAQWRYRMGTDAAKTLYKLRAATAECINAIARNRGLQQFRVRSLAKVKAVLLWFALAHNLMRAVELRLTAPAGT